MGRPGVSTSLRVDVMNPFQDMFDRQKRHFATGATRSRGWRVEQLDRMSRLVAENEAALQQAIGKDFKTASQEQIFETQACLGEVAFQKSQLGEWMKPVEAPVPRALAAEKNAALKQWFEY
jgi:aldehyde dehydrogenase (NAD+)